MEIKRVLIVDDEQAIRDLVTRILTEAGYEIACAKNGVSGLELAIKRPYDLVISDMEMPGVPGVQMVREMRHAGVRTPVIMMSGNWATFEPHEVLSMMERQEVQCLIKKPFERAEFLLEVNRAISVHRTN